MFLSDSSDDARALGRLGLCVAMADTWKSGRMFIGLIKPDESLPASTTLVLSLPTDDKAAQARARIAFQLYFSQTAKYSEHLERLCAGQEVTMPGLPIEEAKVWQRRLSEWSILVSEIDAA